MRSKWQNPSAVAVPFLLIQNCILHLKWELMPAPIELRLFQEVKGDVTYPVFHVYMGYSVLVSQ